MMVFETDPDEQMAAANHAAKHPNERLRVQYPNETRDWLPVVMRDLRAHGWKVHHMRGAKGDDRGYPDIHAVHTVTGRTVIAELKTETGKLTRDQAEWLVAFAKRGEVYIWRPRDHAEILDVIEYENLMAMTRH